GPGAGPGRGRRVPARGRASRSCQRLLDRAGRRIGRGDDRAAQAGLALVQHHGLARGHGALGALEGDPQGPGLVNDHFAWLLWLSVARLRRAAETGGRRGARDPVRALAVQAARHEMGAVVALVNDQHVGRDVLAHDVPGPVVESAAATDPQAFALAEGVVEHALVLAQVMAVGRPDRPRARGQVAAEEFPEVTLAHEADAGGVLLRRSRQAGGSRHRAHGPLVEVAEREQGGGQLFLAQLVQEVALVLATVGRAQQPPLARRVVDARVVAGGDPLGPELTRGVEEVAELDLAVAQH